MADKQNRIGGASLTEEAVTGLLMSGITSIFHGIEKKEAAQKMLRNLPSVVEMLLSPVVLNTAFAALPDFGHPEVAQGLKHIMVHMAGEIADMSHDAKHQAGLTDDDYATAFKRADAKFYEKMVAIQGMLAHELDCAELPPQRPQGKGKDDGNRQQQGGRSLLPLPIALRREYRLCQICFGLDSRKPQPEDPAPAARKPEPLEIIANCQNKGATDQFTIWFGSLSGTDKNRVLQALTHLSSEQEFIGMMALIHVLKPEDMAVFIDRLETLLQADEVKRADATNFFDSIGSVVQSGGNVALELVSTIWNAKSEPASPVAHPDEESDYLPRRWLFGFIPLPRRRKPGTRVGIIKSLTF